MAGHHHLSLGGGRRGRGGRERGRVARDRGLCSYNKFRSASFWSSVFEEVSWEEAVEQPDEALYQATVVVACLTMGSTLNRCFLPIDLR